VYKGFNKQPLAKGERFAHLQDNDASDKTPGVKATDKYFPIKLLCKFDLGNLPSDEVFFEVINSHLPKDEQE
jgi:hypothetical protein